MSRRCEGRDTLRSPPKGELGGVTTTLTDIADRLERLAPSHRNPEGYFEAKAELVFEIREIAGAVRRAGHVR